MNINFGKSIAHEDEYIHCPSAAAQQARFFRIDLSVLLFILRCWATEWWGGLFCTRFRILIEVCLILTLYKTPHKSGDIIVPWLTKKMTIKFI